MTGERFYVVALEGYAIHPGRAQAGNARLMLTASVLDRFYCHREVARYTVPRAVPGGYGTHERRWGWVRDQAAAEAARLNALVAD